MKKIFFSIAMILCVAQTNAQDCSELSQLNETLKKEIAELKKILLLVKPQKEFKAKDLAIKLISVEGDKREQSVKIEVLFNNTGVNIDRMTTSVKSVIEAGGNEVVLHKAFLGAKEVKGFIGGSTELYRDTPLKCTYIFKGVVPETLILKAFPLPFRYHKEGTKSTDMVEDRVIFNDITIDWD